jgi:hypothetical protein
MSAAAFTIGQPFNPYKLFTGIFIPEALVRYAGLSSTAKLAYGRLARYAGEDGRCFPAVGTLAVEIAVKKRRAQTCLEELEHGGLIRREFQSGKASHYVFLWHSIFSGEPPMHNTAPPPVHKSAHEESHHQESKKKESQARRSGKARSVDATTKETPKAKTKPFSQKVDDDEKPKPRTPLENPEMEFRARITERHGSTVDVDRLLQDVKSELDCGPLSEFLEADLKATTAPGRLTNPHGHYRRLARKILRQKQAAGLEWITSTPLQVQEVKFVPSCTCDDGLLPDGAYCGCGVGSFRKQYDDYMKKTAASLPVTLPEVLPEQATA